LAGAEWAAVAEAVAVAGWAAAEWVVGSRWAAGWVAWASRMGGVFFINDLKNLFNHDSEVQLYRRIIVFEKSGVLQRIKQGFYVTENFDPELLACRIYPDSYISFGNILAKELIIGSVPEKTIYLVKAGRNKLFTSPTVTLVYFGTAQDFQFGSINRNGKRYATPEKAFLDILYFYQKGHTFSFDIFNDIDISRLDTKKIESWLKHYKNPNYISFVKGVISAGTR
jgi:hypothetical protein